MRVSHPSARDNVLCRSQYISCHCGKTSNMADEDISYRPMVNDEGDAMTYAVHGRDFGRSGDRTGQGRKWHRRKAGEAGSPSERRSRRPAAEGDRLREIALVLARSGGQITDSMERKIDGRRL